MQKRVSKTCFRKSQKNRAKRVLTPLKNNIVVFGLRNPPNAETPQAEKQAQLNTNEKIIKNKKLSYQDSINPSAPQKSFQQKSADERMMDEYTQKFEIYKEIIKQNIDFYEFASWLDQYCDDDEDCWG